MTILFTVVTKLFLLSELLLKKANTDLSDWTWVSHHLCLSNKIVPPISHVLTLKLRHNFLWGSWQWQVRSSSYLYFYSLFPYFVPKVLIYILIQFLVVPVFFHFTCTKPQWGALVNVEILTVDWPKEELPMEWHLTPLHYHITLLASF